MLAGKRIVILVEEGFEDSELMEPLRAMKDAGARVVLAGSGSKPGYKGKHGSTKIKVDTTADRIKLKDFDALIIPGGYAPDKMRLHKPMVDLVKTAHDKDKVIAAICHGDRGCRVTSWPSIAVDLKNAGAIWVDEPVVRDGNIITSRRPVDLPKFNKAIAEALL